MAKVLAWLVTAGLAFQFALANDAAQDHTSREACYTEVTLGPNDDDDQFIFSPNYPSNYDNDQNCTWNITVFPAHLIRMQVVSLNIERQYDNLDISNVNPNDGSVTRIARLSGSGAKEIEYITDYNTALIQFSTDGSVTDQGFYIKFKATIGSKKCTAEVLEWADGFVFSDGYQWVTPVCSWSINTGDNTLVGLSLDDYAAATEGYDLVFYDGPTSGDPELFRTNRTKVENAVSFTSSSNQIFVEINGGNTAVAVDYAFYFFAVYSGGSSSCNFQYDATTDTAPGAIKSPVYPHFYPPGISCQWMIVGSISLVIETMSLPVTDTVTVYQGSSASGTVLKVCNKDEKCEENDMIRSDGSVLVVMDSKAVDDLETGYFKFKYYTNLDAVYETDGNSGFAVSPNYPADYPSRGDQYYYISVESGNNIDFYFVYFNTESVFDTLALYDGASTISTQIATLSGQHTGYSGSTSGQYLTMHFSSDLTSQLKGFMMSYTSEITSRSYTAYSEISIDSEYDYTVLGSPGVPDLYPADTGFVWYFTATFAAYRIDFTFFRIDIDPTDFAKVFAGHSTAVSDLVTTIQGNKYFSYTYAVVYDTQATIWLYSGSSFTGNGFLVEYWAWE